MNEDMGIRIKNLRKEKKLTQSELADILDVSASTVGMYEQNNRRPEYDTLVKLSEVFNVSTDYLITGLIEESDVSKALQNILKDEILVAFEDYENWSDEDKKELLSYLSAKKISRKK